MPEPKDAAALQQFLSAANWIRMFIIDYASVVSELQTLLQSITSKVGSLKAKKLMNYSLENEWQEKHSESFKRGGNV